MNNIFCGIGRITKNLEIRYGKDGKPILKFSIAINNGKDDTTFLEVTSFNGIAENVSKYCKKGDLIAVTGYIKNNNWEDDKGNKHYDYSFVASKVTFLATKGEKNDNNLEDNKNDENNDYDPYKEMGIEVNMEDLPF